MEGSGKIHSFPFVVFLHPTKTVLDDITLMVDAVSVGINQMWGALGPHIHTIGFFTSAAERWSIDTVGTTVVLPGEVILAGLGHKAKGTFPLFHGCGNSFQCEFRQTMRMNGSLEKQFTVVGDLRSDNLPQGILHAERCLSINVHLLLHFLRGDFHHLLPLEVRGVRHSHLQALGM